LYLHPLAEFKGAVPAAQEFLGRFFEGGLCLVVAITVIATSLLFLFGLKVLLHAQLCSSVNKWTALLTAAFAIPAVIGLTYTHGLGPGFTRSAESSWRDALFLLTPIVIDCSAVVFFLTRSRDRSPRPAADASVLFLHYVAWAYIIRSAGHVGILSPVLMMLFIAGPISGLAWLIYWKVGPDPSGRSSEMRMRIWNGLGAVVSLCVLVYLWTPVEAHRLAGPKNLSSVHIELTRGSCLGACPVYSLTIHGNGQIEYLGKYNVKVHGRETAAISKEQVTEILAVLHRIGLVDLEDRAFRWCYDTPRVTLLLSIDGKSKRLVSDAACVGGRLGKQAQFVSATDQIENIVGTARWVKCEGQCQN
jgi:hypothetical protein